ncbi:hypothetical protein M9H77_18400 [Catharanthus roseus]|uniref:Uncharacterized protein n=1 Tax=Catharanthus roseus TaxID=4058 RepID=A0ACC0B7E5_CATRO|nr:hypothetical protein M9H77_18400 [Catharanthus roseus]
MEDDFGHVQQALKGLEQQLSWLAKGQSSRRDFDRHPMHDNQWGYGEPRNDVRNGGYYVNMDERFQKRRDDYEGYYDSYNYGGYNYRKSSQTLKTTSRPLTYNNLKLPLSCGTFCRYDYEACEQKMKSLCYSYSVGEEEKFQLVLKSFSYEVNVWWDCKCENRMRMGARPIKTWSLMKTY